jgi:diguanylate cyclase (GGDEF)-like protein/PAS domain S-box-containing protein
MKFRLHHRYFLAIILLVAAAMGSASAALLVQYERSMAEVRETTSRTLADALREQFQDRIQGLALVTAQALVNPLALLNAEGIRDVLRAVEAEPDVVSVSLHSEFGGAFVESLRVLSRGATPQPLPNQLSVSEVVGGGHVEVTAPIKLGDQLLGAVTVGLSKSRIETDSTRLTAELARIDESAKRTRSIWLSLIAVILAVSAFLSAVLVARSLSKPVRLLSALTERIGRGDYEVRVAIHRTDEIGDLGRALHAMASNLQKTTVSRDNFLRILNSMQDALLVTTLDGRITDANEAAARLIGCSDTDLVGQPISAWVPEGFPRVEPRSGNDLRLNGFNSLETTLFATGRRNVPILLSAATIRSKDGAVQGLVCVLHDITERKRIEAQMRHMAHHDALTGLANRMLLQDRLHQAMAHARREGTSVALLMLDLDSFKEINDTLGHPLGDSLLAAVARRIKLCLRDVDTVARLGGDEFAIVQLDLRERHDAEVLSTRLLGAFDEPFKLDGHEVFASTSIGIAVFPSDGEDIDRLMKNADMALYDAKARGRRTFRFFETSLDVRLQERKRLERDLRLALHRGELTLQYQPIVDIASRRMIGVEALLRWNHPERGILPPEMFIHLAEQTGLIVSIGRWVLETACVQAATWRTETGCNVRIAVNISPPQLYQQDFMRLVQTALRRANLAPCLLELEVTEDTLLQYSESSMLALHQLKHLGVRISMDDFGTGYSSLSRLRRFPFDAIKIDRSFVRDAERDAGAAAIVRAAVTLSHSFGMLCIAEGVETQQQLDFLEREQCRVAQGYYFSPPVSSEEIDEVLKKTADELAIWRQAPSTRIGGSTAA